MVSIGNIIDDLINLSGGNVNKMFNIIKGKNTKSNNTKNKNTNNTKKNK